MGDENVHVTTRELPTAVGATCYHLQPTVDRVGYLSNLEEGGVVGSL